MCAAAAALDILSEKDSPKIGMSPNVGCYWGGRSKSGRSDSSTFLCRPEASFLRSEAAQQERLLTD